MRGSKSVLAVVFAVVVCGVLVLGAGSAFAGLSYPFDGTLAPAGGSFGFLEAGSVAVDDSNGHTYVADSHSGTVDVFETASGAQLASLDGALTPAGSFGGGQVEVAANNGTGEVYVLDSTDNVVDVFEAGGGYACQITASAIPSATECNGVAGSAAEAGPFSDPGGIAVDQATGDVYVVDAHNSVVDVFSSAGAYVRQISLATIPSGFGGLNKIFTRDVAVDDANGEVFVADSGLDGVYVFNAAGEYAATWTGANVPSLGSFGGAYVSVAADNSGGDVYVLDSQHSVIDVFDSSGKYLAQFSHSFEQPRDVAVGQASGKIYVADETVVDIFGPGFVPPPSVTGDVARNLRGTSVDLTVNIDPNGLDTTYRFEYGTSAAYGTSIPVPDGAIAAASGAQSVIQHVSGLQANTTYHWRVVAHNQSGTTTGVDHTFIYDTSGEGLPDNRAYEMVTPPQKNGALIGTVFLGLRPDIAEDGSRVIAPSVQCFAGSGSCAADRETEGDPFAFTRTSGGWVASPLAPSAGQLEFNTPVALNATAGTALFSGPTGRGRVEDFYARRSDGSLADVGPVLLPSIGPSGYREHVQTADLSHIVYETEHDWPFDATTQGTGLYEYVGSGNTAPVLVGVSGGPGSTDLISKCGTTFLGGPGVAGFDHSLSIDGRTVFFTAKACASGSGVNAGVAVPADTLYARVDESRTVLISGRSPADCTGACLGSAPSNAEFQGASVDGSRVFFTSRQRLTNDASEGEQNLYEYDFLRPAGGNLVAVSAGDTSGSGPSVQGVEAIASDGSHVYFVATGVLTSVANSGGQVPQAGADNLYVYERDAAHPGGRVAFVATVPSSDEEFVLRGEGRTGFIVGVANVTPDGRFLVFLSHGRLTPDTGSGGFQEVFRYDSQTGELVRISTGERGFNDNGNGGAGDAGIVSASKAFSHVGQDPTMSHDGSYVFFESPVALTPRALNDVQVAEYEGQPSYAENVYEWHEGRVYLISDGRDTAAQAPYSANVPPSWGLSSVQLLGSDATGANVFFSTDDRLVGQDTDTEMDYYDARICTAGEPCIGSSPPAEQCVGEGCRGASSGAPSLSVPASASFTGPGNLAPEAKAVVKVKTKPTRKAHGKKAKKKAKGKRKKGKHVKAKRSVRSTRRGR